MFKPGHSIRLRGSALTNTGKVRDNNEDSVHLWVGNSQIMLAVVADGMGGAVAGEEASRIAIEAIQTGLTQNGAYPPEKYYKMPQEKLVSHLTEAIRTANINIVDQAKRFPELKGMGTTVTLALIIDTDVVVGHVGDSRAYLVDGHSGDIDQITSDHSFVQALVAAGHISEEEAEDHPMRNVLYRALGQSPDLEVDVYYQQLRVGDRLVLCSDGLTLHVKPDEIADMALAQDEPEISSQQLVDLANQRGGRDNVSVIVVSVEEDPESTHEVSVSDIEKIKIVEPDLDEDDTMTFRDGVGFSSSESSSSMQEHPESSITNRRTTGSFPSVEKPVRAAGMMVNITKPQPRRQPPYDSELHGGETLGEGNDTFSSEQ